MQVTEGNFHKDFIFFIPQSGKTRQRFNILYNLLQHPTYIRIWTLTCSFAGEAKSDFCKNKIQQQYIEKIF